MTDYSIKYDEISRHGLYDNVVQPDGATVWLYCMSKNKAEVRPYCKVMFADIDSARLSAHSMATCYGTEDFDENLEFKLVMMVPRRKPRGKVEPEHEGILPIFNIFCREAKKQ
jgi:hypothetical protein